MKTQLEKAQQMMRIHLLEEILLRRKIGDNLEKVKEAFLEKRTLPLIKRIATLMLPNLSKQQIIMTLPQELNLTPMEERALVRILNGL
tara:strand:+ start:293 stop:556 length:264 start_codon:yes stop_codon:yes gene_type:complete